MMGKSWKYSKGHSAGFVPDYRHAVEIMGESEGFGNMTRMDVEGTASEASYASNKRKSVSLNVDGYDGLSVPMQVLSISKMSRSEKKSLESKLKMELDQIRGLQRKIDTLALDSVVLSPSSEIRSCSDGARKPPFENPNRFSDISAPGKKRVPAQMKKNVAGRFQPAKPAPPTSASNTMLMKTCENLLGRLMAHQFGWVFNAPVDIVELNIPDYFTVIKHPMDLGTIKRKIASGEYSSPLDFAADVRLTFSNAMTYNPAGNDVNLMADSLRKFFEVRWKQIAKKIQTVNDVQTNPSGLHLETEIITPIPPLKKKKISPNEASLLKPEPVRQVIGAEEKQKLGLQLEGLLAELPESILYFLKEHSEGQGNEEEIEIDMDALSDDTFVALRKLVNDYLQEKEKIQSKAEPCEIELRNESGFSNCSVQPSKGNDPVEEDIDIMGGNNPPFLSFPPKEIEKDAAHSNSKPGSPSSSSSESGSSSSDSDSSSDSEVDSPKASVPPPSAPEKNEISASSLDLKRSDPPGESEVPVNIDNEPETAIRGDSEMGNHGDSEMRIPDDSKMGNHETGIRGDPEMGNCLDSEMRNPDDSDMGNSSVAELPQAQQSSQSQPLSTCGDDRQDGESAPSERPVSPEKQYRAALLRNRFADTILKAREKAFEKGEKRDPEKLQKEKEELERRKKEEKARLQAEATAAEEARRKAEQEAAAEAKKKRELQREAARQALQMMEKTVDINENSRFLEDLEMLRTAADGVESPNFIEEASPELSQNGLGSFKLQGNALEQLGLYMKIDDDFEEEEPESEPEPKPELEPELEPKPEPEPEHVPESEPEHVPENKPEPEPESKQAQEIPEQPKDKEEGDVEEGEID